MSGVGRRLAAFGIRRVGLAGAANRASCLAPMALRHCAPQPLPSLLDRVIPWRHELMALLATSPEKETGSLNSTRETRTRVRVMGPDDFSVLRGPSRYGLCLQSPGVDVCAVSCAFCTKAWQHCKRMDNSISKGWPGPLARHAGLSSDISRTDRTGQDRTGQDRRIDTATTAHYA